MSNIERIERKLDSLDGKIAEIVNNGIRVNWQRFYKYEDQDDTQAAVKTVIDYFKGVKANLEQSVLDSKHDVATFIDFIEHLERSVSFRNLVAISNQIKRASELTKFLKETLNTQIKALQVELRNALKSLKDLLDTKYATARCPENEKLYSLFHSEEQINFGSLLPPSSKEKGQKSKDDKRARNKRGGIQDIKDIIKSKDPTIEKIETLIEKTNAELAALRGARNVVYSQKGILYEKKKGLHDKLKTAKDRLRNESADFAGKFDNISSCLIVATCFSTDFFRAMGKRHGESQLSEFGIDSSGLSVYQAFLRNWLFGLTNYLVWGDGK